MVRGTPTCTLLARSRPACDRDFGVSNDCFAEGSPIKGSTSRPSPRSTGSSARRRCSITAGLRARRRSGIVRASGRATGPNQVWSWDITYLKSPIKGVFFYLYVAIDVWSRKIVGWTIEVSESPEHSSRFLAAACEREGVEPGQLVIHSDNGGPMKGATLLATLQALGVATSFSRPSVSNDNPFSESLFGTMKYRPAFPDGPFKSIEDAGAWMTAFVRWYNTEHRHSGIRFVTPEERHSGREAALLEQRKIVYAKARAARPERWARSTRNWQPIGEVVLNPAPADQEARVA